MIGLTAGHIEQLTGQPAERVLQLLQLAHPVDLHLSGHHETRPGQHRPRGEVVRRRQQNTCT